MTHLLYLFLGLVLVAVTLPLVLELALVTAAALLPVRGQRDEDSPVARFPLAIVIPAHNEEFLISRCVRSVRESAAQSAAQDRHRDFRRRAQLHRYALRSRRARQAPRSWSMTIRRLSARALPCAMGLSMHSPGRREAVLVIDADSIVSKNLVPAVQSLLANGAEAVQCRYEMESSTEKINGRLAALALRGFNVIRPRGRERLGLSAGIFGNGFALSRSLLREVPYGAFSVVEDLEYHIATGSGREAGALS